MSFVVYLFLATSLFSFGMVNGMSGVHEYEAISLLGNSFQCSPNSIYLVFVFFNAADKLNYFPRIIHILL